ncbi:delta 9-fatty acid desaturase protein [Mycena leptocephala]|nr:delta 9-fatty acid desaturase protein [Mycena leptocephala]
MDIPPDSTENYVSHTLKTTKPLPPISWNNFFSEINWLNVAILILTPIMGVIGVYYTRLRWETALFSFFYYYYTGFGITAGYHRLWAHRIFSALSGAGAVQGSIKWWSRGHRAHHRYTDTELDPYNANEGFWHTHMGWMLFKPRRKPVVRWQHKYYIPLLLLMCFVVPTIIPWLGWGDARGGYVYAGLVRLCFVHHSTFCVNSLAHWFGESPFDDKHSPRDHVITALCTFGEGYHNFHHQFPMDYRNATKWYQYDPTKWFIRVCQKLGLASHLKVFPDNEVRKGRLTMELKRLRETQEALSWPSDSNDLRAIRHPPSHPHLGFIHDVASFIDEHPGGARWIIKYIGKDATTAFFGGVYDHSNAAHNLLAMKRVGVLQGGIPLASTKRPSPLAAAQDCPYAELASPYASSMRSRTTTKNEGW